VITIVRNPHCKALQPNEAKIGFFGPHWIHWIQ
jgi:hypothetical protein